MPELLDLDLLDDQAAHLFKQAALGIHHVYDVWQSDPQFYPAKLPAHCLMVAYVAGRVLVVPIAPSDSGDAQKCPPIGRYDGAPHLAERYREAR